MPDEQSEGADDVITLTDEEGHERDLQLIDTVQVAEGDYVIVANPGDEDEAFALKLFEDDQGEQYLQPIEDDEEWEKVAEAYANQEA